MARRRPTEVHINHERWLVSYADFITLLFAFFVVMYSISQVNQGKYRVLSETFEHAFNAPGISSADPLVNPASPVITPIPIAIPSANNDPGVIELEQEVARSNAGPDEQFTEISTLISGRFADLIHDELITVTHNELWLQIELKDSILFESGGAEPSLQAQVIFDEIAGILKSYSNPVQVEGFTDNIPINSPRYPSNWELSSARASAIVKLLANKGVAPQRLSAVGYGEFQPLASNDNAEGRAQNRRVALMIARHRTARPGAPASQQLNRLNPSSLQVTPNSADGKTVDVEGNISKPPEVPSTVLPVSVVKESLGKNSITRDDS